jgi:hypothetical protein
MGRTLLTIRAVILLTPGDSGELCVHSAPRTRGSTLLPEQ